MDGIKYQRLGDDHYYAQELFENEELTGYLKNMLDATKSVYEQVVYESDIEARFADQLEKNAAVRVYAKLPGWFAVPTPLGAYRPDWAILVDTDAECGFRSLGGEMAAEGGQGSGGDAQQLGARAVAGHDPESAARHPCGVCDRRDQLGVRAAGDRGGGHLGQQHGYGCPPVARRLGRAETAQAADPCAWREPHRQELVGLRQAAGARAGVVRGRRVPPLPVACRCGALV